MNMKKIFLTLTVLFVLGAMTACKNMLPKDMAPKDDPNNTMIYKIVETEPCFPGGYDSLFAFLNTNVRYPEEAVEKKIEGKIIVTFVVEKDGSITNAQILRDIVYGSEEADSLAAELGCGTEVLRVIDMMPKWEPAVIHGYIVRFLYYLPVYFSLTEGEGIVNPSSKN